MPRFVKSGPFPYTITVFAPCWNCIPHESIECLLFKGINILFELNNLNFTYILLFQFAKKEKVGNELLKKVRLVVFKKIWSPLGRLVSRGVFEWNWKQEEIYPCLYCIIRNVGFVHLRSGNGGFPAFCG